LGTGEIILGFYVSLVEPGQASSFKRIMRPQGVALPIMNNSVWVERDGDTVAQIRVGVGPGGAVPFRARKTEDFFIGNPYSQENFKSALDILVDEVKGRHVVQRRS
jgi:CO/xanthine dehydrogenase FAD-binding subunit